MIERRLTVPQREIQYGPEIRKVLARQRREPHPSQRHRVPESKEDQGRARRITEKLHTLMSDEDFFGQGGAILSMAESFLSMGAITEEQYIETDGLFHQLLQVDGGNDHED